MRSLFLRVFLWFWLAMAIVAAILVVTSPFFTRSRPALESWHQGSEEWARTQVERVTNHIAEQGAYGMRLGRGPGRGKRGGMHSPARIFVLDESGSDVRGVEVPPEAGELAMRTRELGEEQTERSGTLYLVARSVADPSGRRLVVVAVHHSPPKLVHLLEPGALAFRLAVLIVVVGGLSFWLARYLSGPVGALRQATRQLSGGNLAARVGGRVGGRRDEIGELARDFDAMAERIEALVGSQQRLLRDVSHELRSPLARLAVALELARARSGEAAAGALDRIEREAGRLDELVGQLLLLERLEAGETEDATVELDLGVLLAEVVADAGFEAEADDRRVRFEQGGSLVVRGRRGVLRSALDNVLRNAVHHTADGTAVEVRCDAVENGFEITVRDHGPGVADNEVERIFEPFYRVDVARERATGGVGLGLAIAARAVRAHGGTIEAANHPGGGLVVTVYLPKGEI